MSAPTPVAPVVTRSRAEWLGEQRFDAGIDGRAHLIDAKSKEAPGPVETLLNAIATCSGVDVLEILAKRRTPVTAFSVDITGTRRPLPPKRIERLDIDFRVDGEGIDPEQAERAIGLSFEKYCSVAASLASDIVVETRLILNGTAYPPRPRAIWSPDRR